MDKSSTSVPPVADQVRYWSGWNAASREGKLRDTAARQGYEVEAIVSSLGRTDLAILDVGCGTGWLAERLANCGSVTGTDLAESVIERARVRAPHVQFLSGDFFQLQLPTAAFDVVATLEVLAHVADQEAFIGRLSSLLKPDGLLILTTQNRPILERWSSVGAPGKGQIRHWVDARELRTLLSRHLENVKITSLLPVGDQGFLRVVNSVKLNELLSKLVSRKAIERLKERAMLGGTLPAVATRRH